MADNSFDELMKRAQAAATRLAAATDELNAYLSVAEEALAGIKLGVSGSVTLYLEDELPESVDLAFDRDGTGWRLFVWRCRLTDDEIIESKPILKASRDDRVAAAKALPRLLEQLTLQVESEVLHVANGAQQAAEFVQSIGSMKGRR